MHHQPTPSFQEWIVPSFVTDGCGLAVAGDDECIVIERHELSFDRSDDVLVRTTPEVGPADALHKHGVTRK